MRATCCSVARSTGSNEFVDALVTVATLSRSLLIDRCPCRVGYLCEPSSYVAEDPDRLVQSGHSCRGDFRWRFHRHVGFCTGPR